jgi:predicted alpha-1,2-mannosidase
MVMKIMNNKFAIVLLLFYPFLMFGYSNAVASNELPNSKNYVQYVTPIIGTNTQSSGFSYGNKKPYVAVPMPVVLISPQMDNQFSSAYYRYCQQDLHDTNGVCPDSSIKPISGFRFSHEPTPYGLGDYGYFSLMPLPGSFNGTPTEQAIETGGYGTFSHTDEKSSAYNYTVTFANEMTTSLTATRRSGYIVFNSPDDKLNIVLSLNGTGYTGNEIVWNKNQGFNFSGYTDNGLNSSGLPKGFKSFFNLDFYSQETMQPLQPASVQFWDANTSTPISPTYDDNTGEFTVKGENLIAMFTFDQNNVSALVGTSYVSESQAKFNMANELGSSNGTNWQPFTFYKIKKRNKDLWNKYLGRVSISGANFNESDFDVSRIAFYTAVYRTLINPHAWFECSKYDGNGNCDTAHTIEEDGTYHYDYIFHRSPYQAYQNNENGEPVLYNGYLFSDEGMWDVYRTKYPFYSLIFPDVESNIIQGYLNTYQEGGWLPKWPDPGYKNSMTGTHADCVVADAYVRGIRDYNPEVALNAVMKDFFTDPIEDNSCGNGSLCGRSGFKELKEYGYVPVTGGASGSEATGNSLDYAYDDFCISNMAQAISRNTSNQTLKMKAMLYSEQARRESESIINALFDFDTEYDVMYQNSSDVNILKGFFHSKDVPDNGWVTLPPSTDLSGLYTWKYGYNEGSAWQFMFYMQYDVPSLASMFAKANDLSNSKEALEKQLDLFFTSTSNSNAGGYGSKIHEALEMEHVGLGQFEFNNQPVWGYAYEYNYTDAPWKTQCIVRDIMDPNRSVTHTNYNCFGSVPAGGYGEVYNLFSNGPQGLFGDEDTGSMSAWFLNSAMGFYPIPGTDKIVFGSPLFNSVKIKIPAYDDKSAKSLIIIAPNNSEKNIYVDSIELNGKKLKSNEINQKDLFLKNNDGILKFNMTDSKPGK